LRRLRAGLRVRNLAKEALMKYHEFLKAVRERTGTEDPEEAERTAVAVVQALSDRLAGGEPKDLLSQLPGELKERVEPIETAIPMKSEEFVERVAHDLEIDPDEARERVRAVLSVVRDAVTPGEFEDVLSQLDREYEELLV